RRLPRPASRCSSPARSKQKRAATSATARFHFTRLTYLLPSLLLLAGGLSGALGAGLVEPEPVVDGLAPKPAGGDNGRDAVEVAGGLGLLEAVLVLLPPQ